MARGDLDAAMASFQDAFATVQGVAKAMPRELQWQRDLAIGYGLIGYIHLANAHFVQAEASFLAARAIDRQLADHAPACLDDQFGLTLMDDRLAQVAEACGNLNAAEASQRDSLSALIRLVDQSPGNLDWQRALYAGHFRLGRLLERRGDITGAEASFRSAVRIGDRLSARDPANLVWLRDLSNCHLALVNIALARLNGPDAGAPGRLAAAEAALRAVLNVFEQLVEREPDDAGVRERLAAYYLNLRNVQARRGDISGAQASFAALRALQKRWR
jgi:tetratricopeptide (TPR) repeat protein